MMLPAARLAANIAWLFTELHWLDRFGAARRTGFSQVEFPWPERPAATTEAVRDAGVSVALLNAPAGDLAAGERGWPNDPARVEEWQEALREALDLAGAVRCPKINVLAGNAVSGLSRIDELGCLEENLRWALPMAAAMGVTLVTELLNRRENPSYLLATLDECEVLLERLAPLGWKLQLDTWHLGLTDLDVPAAIRRAGGHIGHVQVADVPGRHEPGTGSLDWDGILAALEDAGYTGSIGLEFTPLGRITRGSLRL